MLLSENRFALFGIMLEAGQFRPILKRTARLALSQAGFAGNATLDKPRRCLAPVIDFHTVCAAEPANDSAV
jgi:hypothetical protein